MAITYHAGRRVQGLEYTAGSTITYETDFSTDTDWEGGDGKNEVDTSTERLDFDIRRDGSNDKIYYDLGSALSNTAWVIRFKLVMIAKSYTSGSGIVGFFGMSSVTGDALTTQDFLGLRKHIDDNDTSATINNTIVSDGAGSSLGNPTSGTQYHEMKRTSATSWTNSVYSTSDYSGTPDATHTLTISSGIQGLQYFNITNYDSGSGSGTMTGYIDDLEIYDGITSVVASTGDTKPTNVQVGSRWEETDTRKMYHYNPSANITTDGSYTVLKFTETGTFTPTSAFNVEYLVVAGGGGGGSGYGGGGGAGGYLTGTGHGVTAQAYTITVGDGGAGNTANGQFGGDGDNSVFSSFTSVGGGGGSRNNFVGRNGGSGGGGGYYSKVGGTATSGQGYNGGTGAGGAPCYSGGGGGGASEVGQAGGNGAASDGGDGLANDILVTGTNVYYAGGGGGQGGGATQSCSAGTGIGGNGGGGNSSSDGSTTPDTEDGTDGLGGGGGGTNNNATYNSGQITGVGGSGVVIIRFLTSGNTYTSSLVNTWSEEGT